MTGPRDLRIADFTYVLPDDRIARFPLSARDQSRLLVWRGGTTRDTTYAQIADELPPDALLVFNNTRVVEARLRFQKPTGGVIEIFCLAPHEKYADPATAMAQRGHVWWQCLIGGAAKWKPGQVLEKKCTIDGRAVALNAIFREKRADHFVVELRWDDDALSFAAVLHAAGSIPLPPYLEREPDASDSERYQTIYAKEDGSVAAPTAGLHFTPTIFEKLTSKGIRTTEITLHVGAGTFLPVKSETLGGHPMHEEYFDVPAEALAALREKRPVIAVGTTSLRTLESLHWAGLQLLERRAATLADLRIGQWEPYGSHENVPLPEALDALESRMQAEGVRRLIGRTSLLIAPGYRFRVVSGLVTNFHQPQSTLLLLVAALLGPSWKKLYEEALEKNYRFLSYGDGCLLLMGTPS